MRDPYRPADQNRTDWLCARWVIICIPQSSSASVYYVICFLVNENQRMNILYYPCGNDTDYLSAWIFQYHPTMMSFVGSETCQRLPAPQHGQICSQRQIDPRPRLVHEWMILYSTHSQTTASILKFSYFLGVALLAMLRDKAEHFFTRNLSCFWLVGHILIRPDPWS